LNQRLIDKIIGFLKKKKIHGDIVWQSEIINTVMVENQKKKLFEYIMV
jgi:hypothetical protein